MSHSDAYSDAVVERVLELWCDHTAAEVADVLRQEGNRRLTKSRVQGIVTRARKLGHPRAVRKTRAVYA